MATRRLARWTIALSSSTLPASIKTAALDSFYNYVGCALAGSSHPATLHAVRALQPLFGAPSATVLGAKPVLADPLSTTLINGLASHVHDYDDTHLSTIIHPTGPVASALLSYSEYSSRVLKTPISGTDFLTALAAGIETECKLGLSVWPSHYDVGWHITCTVGSIGAAIGVSKLMNLNETQTMNAIGLASCQVIGHRENFGSEGKAFGVGRASQGGLQAAFLAQAGMTSSEYAIEGKRGWVATVCPDKEKAFTELSRRISELENQNASDWETAQNAFKPFPCGIVIHPIIDGCSQLSKSSGPNFDPLKIKSVALKVHPLVLELTGKKFPKDGLEGKFSVYHGAACGLLFGKAGPAQYLDEVVTDSKLVDLRAKIEAIADNKLRADECYIAVKMDSDSGGHIHEKHIEHAVGSLEVPMTREQLTEKFVDQVGLVEGIGRERAEKASEVVWGVGETEDLVEVLEGMMGR